MKYLLTYDVNDHADAGGGLQFEEFDTLAAMDIAAHELLNQNTANCERNQSVRGHRVESSFTYKATKMPGLFEAIDD